MGAGTSGNEKGAIVRSELGTAVVVEHLDEANAQIFNGGERRLFDDCRKAFGKSVGTEHFLIDASAIGEPIGIETDDLTFREKGAFYAEFGGKHTESDVGFRLELMDGTVGSDDESGRMTSVEALDLASSRIDSHTDHRNERVFGKVIAEIVVQSVHQLVDRTTGIGGYTNHCVKA